MDSSKEIFKGKTLQDLYKEIYDNAHGTKRQLKELIEKVKDQLRENPSAIVAFSEILTDYLETGIKNDDQLLKLANLILRSEAKTSEGFDLLEIHDLLEEQENIQKQIKG